MAKRKKEWPPWWDWELDFWTHAEERMEDRGFTEVELRRMMEIATDFRRARRRGRWVIKTKHKGKRWEVVVKPDPMTKFLEVITAYPEKRSTKKK